MHEAKGPLLDELWNWNDIEILHLTAMWDSVSVGEQTKWPMSLLFQEVGSIIGKVRFSEWSKVWSLLFQSDEYDFLICFQKGESVKKMREEVKSLCVEIDTII